MTPAKATPAKATLTGATPASAIPKGIAPTDRPRLPRGVRLHHDRVRDVPVLLGPEVALMLDPIGQAVLAEVDGTRDLDAIAGLLAARYDAPPDKVRADIAEFLDGLIARRLVDLA